MEFQGPDHDCALDRNWTLPCMQVRGILNTVRDVRTHTQVYIQHQVRRIHEVIAELPTITRRGHHGFLSDAISQIMGLATKDKVRAITHILQQVEKGIYESARLWGDGARSLTAPFKLEQNRMHNVFEILKSYRQTIRAIQYDFMHSHKQFRNQHRQHDMITAKAIHFISNTTD